MLNFLQNISTSVLPRSDLAPWHVSAGAQRPVSTQGVGVTLEQTFLWQANILPDPFFQVVEVIGLYTVTYSDLKNLKGIIFIPAHSQAGTWLFNSEDGVVPPNSGLLGILVIAISFK